jgi:hypothetical protein
MSWASIAWLALNLLLIGVFQASRMARDGPGDAGADRHRR